MKHLIPAIAVLFSSTLLLAKKRRGMDSLFDGKSTKGWTPRAKVESFVAKDGELQLFSKVNVWVVSDLKMRDFEVEAEVKIPLDYKGFNSDWASSSLEVKANQRATSAKSTSPNLAVFTV